MILKCFVVLNRLPPPLHSASNRFNSTNCVIRPSKLDACENMMKSGRTKTKRVVDMKRVCIAVPSYPDGTAMPAALTSALPQGVKFESPGILSFVAVPCAGFAKSIQAISLVRTCCGSSEWAIICFRLSCSEAVRASPIINRVTKASACQKSLSDGMRAPSCARSQICAILPPPPWLGRKKPSLTFV